MCFIVSGVCEFQLKYVIYSERSMENLNVALLHLTEFASLIFLSNKLII